MAIATSPRRADLAAIAAATAIFLWPALYNGYPLVFADTGTYLRQAIGLYVGWDRTPFYSLFLHALHWRLTTWTCVVAQALIVAHLLWLTGRAFGGISAGRYLAACIVLAGASSLPWFAAQLMPDIFTPVVALAVALLVLVPDRLGPRTRWYVALLLTGAIMVHQTHLFLVLGLMIALVPLRRWLGATAPLRRTDWARLIAAPALAMAAAVVVWTAAFGLPGLSPYGQIFLLARLLNDGPARETLARECPRPDWRLCTARDRIPLGANDFLWAPDSPIYDGEGPKGLREEAGAIVAATLVAQPGAVARAALGNTLVQFTMFRTGDGLEPFPGDPGPELALRRYFPAREYAAFVAARQATATLTLPFRLAPLHLAFAVAALAASLLLLRARPARGVALAALLILLGNAFLTGALSGPHHRYQARVMWLPFAAALLLLGAAPPGSSAGATTLQRPGAVTRRPEGPGSRA